MNKAIVLVMHGMTPSDFPVEEKKEFMRLHAQVHDVQGADPELIKKHDELEHKMRQWPRSEANDPFYTAAKELAQSMELKSGLRVYLGFNEFCAPSFQDALKSAVSSGSEEVSIVTPMVTRGGVHSEVEIPEIIEEARKENPEVRFSYAWPYSSEKIADFLLEQVDSCNQPKIR